MICVTMPADAAAGAGGGVAPGVGDGAGLGGLGGAPPSSCRKSRRYRYGSSGSRVCEYSLSDIPPGGSVCRIVRRPAADACGSPPLLAAFTASTARFSIGNRCAGGPDSEEMTMLLAAMLGRG